MILGAGIRNPTLPPVAGFGGHRPKPDEVRGVVVEPPRDMNVVVRVEIVTDGNAQPAWVPQPAAAERDAEPQEYSREAVLLSSHLEATRAASRLGAADARRAAAAYGEHANWQQYHEARRKPGEPAPQHISLRA
jgi:hypothetical protein